jgi:hypothetical protein
MKALKGIILAAIVMLLVAGVSAQEIARPAPADRPDVSKDAPGENPQQLISSNYGFSIQAGIALEDMSSDTTELIAPGTDNNNSIVVSTGFLLHFLGNTVTNFSVNGNGVMRMSATPIAGANNTNQTVTSANAPRIMPYWDDLCVGSIGKVHFKRVGSPGSRKLVVEWKNMKVHAARVATEPAAAPSRCGFSNIRVSYSLFTAPAYWEPPITAVTRPGSEAVEILRV